MVTPALFAKYPNAAALARAAASTREANQVSTGFFRQKSKALIGMSKTLVDEHGGEVPADMERLTSAARRRPQDRERRARSRARRPRTAGRSTCAPRVEPHRYRRGRRSCQSRSAAVRGAAERRCGHSRRTCRSFTAAASAGRSRSATSAWSVNDCDYYRSLSAAPERAVKAARPARRPRPSHDTRRTSNVSSLKRSP